MTPPSSKDLLVTGRDVFTFPAARAAPVRRPFVKREVRGHERSSAAPSRAFLEADPVAWRHQITAAQPQRVHAPARWPRAP